MIRKKDLSENFSNEALEYAIKNVVSENSQDNQNTLISELLNTYLYTLVDIPEQAEDKVQGFTLLQKIENKETSRCNARRHKHAASGRDADEDAVVNEACHSCQWNEQRPKEIRHGGIDDRYLISKQPEERTTSRGINKGEQHYHQNTPESQPAAHLAELSTVAGTVGFAT